mgnify:CR=1 FL=1
MARTPDRSYAHRVRRSAITLVLAVALLVPASASPSEPRAISAANCGDTGYWRDARAERVRASKTSCRRALKVARGYLKRQKVSGWRCRTKANASRTCRRKSAKVTFVIVSIG